MTPPVLQPLEPFLELSGEDIRRRIFVTQDAGGAELCLRPEFTIPVCRLHRAQADGQAADYSYCGPVFRLAADEPDEFFQAGIESIGRHGHARGGCRGAGPRPGGPRPVRPLRSGGCGSATWA